MKREHILKMVMLAMLVAIGVVISPILRVEGMCPMAHLINIVCSVFLGPWYSLLCATLIGIIRMTLMGIPPLALTGAVFGAFLSGVFYRLSGGKILCAVLGEVFGTGVIGALASYPVMTYIVGRVNSTPFVRQYDIMFNRWGDFNAKGSTKQTIYAGVQENGCRNHEKRTSEYPCNDAGIWN